MSVQLPEGNHQCNNPMCRCSGESDSENAKNFCGDFCKDVETSSELQRCGCGHMACDPTIQYGNEGSLD